MEIPGEKPAEIHKFQSSDLTQSLERYRWKERFRFFPWPSVFSSVPPVFPSHTPVADNSRDTWKDLPWMRMRKLPNFYRSERIMAGIWTSIWKLVFSSIPSQFATNRRKTSKLSSGIGVPTECPTNSTWFSWHIISTLHWFFTSVRTFRGLTWILFNYIRTSNRHCSVETELK